MPFAELPDDIRLHYEDTAPGDTQRETVIAIHGMLGTARRHLGGVIDWLAAEYRVLGPTLRGYGRSRPRPRRYPPNFYRRDAEDVLAFMDALGLTQPVHVMGFSDGGEVALLCGGLAPQRFRSVVVWGAVGYFGPALRDVVTAPGYIERLAPTPTLMTLHGIVDREAVAREWIDAVLGMIDAGGDVSLSTADRITAPLLMMLGKQDRLNPAAYAEQYIEKAGHGTLALFDCGHPIHTQQPDAFRQTVGDFLRGARTG